MKRRSFLATIAGIFAAPFVAKKAVAATPKSKPYTVAVDPSFSMENCRHAAALIRVGPDFEREVLDRWDRTKESLPAWQERMRKHESLADFAYAQACDDIFGTKPWLK